MQHRTRWKRNRDESPSPGMRPRGTGAGSGAGARRGSAGRVETADTGVPPRAGMLRPRKSKLHGVYRCPPAKAGMILFGHTGPICLRNTQASFVTRKITVLHVHRPLPKETDLGAANHMCYM